MFQAKAKVIKNIAVTQKCYKIVLLCHALSKGAQPGQFLMVKVDNGSEVLLRRPFGIHAANGRSAEILYEVVGRGTEILTRKKPGEYLDIIGPLGKGFSILDPRSSILVAGGIGVAPLLFLAEEIVARLPVCRTGRDGQAGQSRKVTSKPLVLIGAKTKKQILCEKEFKKSGCEVEISTDDGSKGFKGKVSELLKRELSTVNCQQSAIYACGPKPMLQEIGRIAKKYKIPAQISLEEHMACGIGACLGCVVKTKQGLKRVCKEGPVFSAEEIIW
ncbi:MAG: dihydroorotate dehydrogenase electron transfer subunit [Candidatus Omnitrophota bacterium]|nr:MAG: dihydroorotate dehydrogenase electron transfer subunit [Candidatus Omnitrophota bacterium]